MFRNAEYSFLPSPAGSGSRERRSARSEWDARSRLGNSGLLIPVDHGTASGRQQPVVAGGVTVEPLHQHPPAISAAHLPQDRRQVPLAIGAQHLLELPAIGCGLVAASGSTGKGLTQRRPPRRFHQSNRPASFAPACGDGSQPGQRINGHTPSQLAGDLVHLALKPGNLGAGPLVRLAAREPVAAGLVPARCTPHQAGPRVPPGGLRWW